MIQSPILAFKSLAFRVEPGEDDATNPGIFGRALANWLSDALQERGVPAGEIIAEDFGWCIRVGAKSEKLYLACAGSPDAGWRVFAFKDRGLLAGVFGRGAPTDEVDGLFVMTKDILQAAPEVLGLSEEDG
jgi:hypothetical protein